MHRHQSTALTFIILLTKDFVWEVMTQRSVLKFQSDSFKVAMMRCGGLVRNE